jgi:hypothetical protein
MTILRRPESRLVLQRAEFGRAPGWDDDGDFNVMWRGRAVGRIYRFDRNDDPGREGFSWHW